MGPEDLNAVLSKLPPLSDPRVLVSSDTVDDAGVYLLDEESALVFTTDFFTPVVDDARDFGRIAAANAVSDVYAMGGSPLIGVNIVCFPDGDLPPELLAEILLGSREKMDEAGAAVVGGHSVSDRELKFGLAVIGKVAPERLVRNSGAAEGDVLVLTKPIGTGVMTTALKNEALDPEGLARVTAVMSELNRSASAAMVEAAADAATDVTGFGLLGHAVGMAKAGGVTLELDVASVPLIEGAMDAISAGYRAGGLFSNQHYYRKFTKVKSRADALLLELLNDPQTSGGLLVALPEDRVEVFAAAYAEAGGERYWRIGRVLPRGEKPVVLV
ncbi:MAG: selenide, water dikinase SelD [Candidatus Eisenbacteria bacterium]|nr:selenide, water dikinase SelD [Candidatus Eisenbacteria bacterium]